MVLDRSLPQLKNCPPSRSQERSGRVGMCDFAAGDVCKDAMCHQNLPNTSCLGVSNIPAGREEVGGWQLTMESRTFQPY
jgi:hypothetical protein